MDELKTILDNPVIKDSKGATLVNMGHITAVILGAVSLYYMIPQRKRKNLF